MRVRYEVLKISQDGLLMDKRFKICGQYILDGFIVISYASLASEYFLDKNKLWDLRSNHGRCLEVVLENLKSYSKNKG